MAQNQASRPVKPAPKKKKKAKKIIRYRRPLNLNVGMVMFAIIFVYMVFSVSTYIRKDKIQFYEVEEGSIVNNKEYTGMIFRQESVKTADRSGYVNYYIREGKRASVGTSVYSIDETGNVAAFLEQNGDQTDSLSSENLSELMNQLTALSLSYDDDQFSTVYDTKYSLDASVLEFMNFNSLEGLGDLLAEAGINFQQVYADQAGTISYGIDSYESMSPQDVTEEMFDKTIYTKEINKSGDLIEQGAPVYKVITSENWSVVFPMTEDELAQYRDQTSLNISFPDHDLTAAAAFSTITGGDGKTYGKLDFDKYMVQFASDRFVNFEIQTAQATGLKNPVSAVTTKNFYLVPQDYLTNGGNDSDTGFNKEVYSEAGTSIVFVPTTIYYSDEEGNCYIEGTEDGLKAGDYIVKADTNERYQIGATASLEGVYNINKGYAVFKQIDILSSNEEYYTVKKNMPYGLSVYDHIVLDASTVEEGQLIYQ